MEFQSSKMKSELSSAQPLTALYPVLSGIIVKI